MLFMCGIGFATIPFVLTLKPKTETLSQKLARVDWIGGFIFIASLTSLLVAVSWGGSEHPWKSAQTLCPLLIGLAGIVAALYYEGYIAKEPFLRRSLFHDISSCAAYFASMSHGLVLYGELYYAPLFLLSCWQSSPIETGVRMLPITIMCAPAAAFTGIFITKRNSYRWAVWAGWLITTFATGLFQFLNPTTPLVAWVLIIIVLGIGLGMILTSQNFATQALCSPVDHGAAAGMYMFLRRLGTALGVGLGGSVFTNVMKHSLQSKGLDSNIASNAEAFIPTLVSLSADDPAKKLLLDAYADGIHGVFYFFLGISIFSGLLALLIKKKDMNKELQTDHKLEKAKNTVVSRMLETSASSTSKVRDSVGNRTYQSGTESIKEHQDE
jgi:Fungal trichothecene efflux pump (TRI12)